MGETDLREPAVLPSRSGRLKGTADALLSSGSLLAALATSSCCLVPFALFSLGISGAWIGNLTALEPLRPGFFAASILMIGLGFLRVRRRSRSAACPARNCLRRPASRSLDQGSTMDRLCARRCGDGVSLGLQPDRTTMRSMSPCA